MRYYAASVVLELLSEPAYILVQGRMEYGIRALSEGLAVLGRCGVTYGSIYFALHRGLDPASLGALPFGLGQLAYGVIYWVVHVLYLFSSSGQTIFSPFPTRITGRWFDPGFLRLSMTMTAQSFFKHILTEGDKLIMSTLPTRQRKGSMEQPPTMAR